MKKSSFQGPSKDRYDVVVLGAGLSGSIMAAILARHGADTLLIDEGAHPRFSIGESTVGHTSAVLKVLADRYDVPELKYLASFKGIQENISSNCGIKRAFGFVYHRDGEQRSEEINQLVIPALLHGPENHLFRQDVDAWLAWLAASYGAELRQNIALSDIELNDDGAVLDFAGGYRVRARYVVDASGPRSLLTSKYGWRKPAAEVLHQARGLFTHMVNVKPYDECIDTAAHGIDVPWAQTTLHHVFDGGWAWVIPFNNHHLSTNPTVSVGLSLDPRKFPAGEMPAEVEFKQIMSRFPSAYAQFKDASSVRNWVSSGRYQYSASKTVGARFCLMSNTSGFIDPLFSRGLANTVDTINAIARPLLEALADNVFSEERFAFVERLQQGLLRCNDELVDTAYKSFSSYPLWNAWLRIWAVGEAGIEQFRLLKRQLAFHRTENPSVYEDLEQCRFPGLLCSDHEGYTQLWRCSLELVRQAHDGQLDPAMAAEHILAALERAQLSAPVIQLHSPTMRVLNPTPSQSLQALLWGKRHAPHEIRALYDFPIKELLRLGWENRRELNVPMRRAA